MVDAMTGQDAVNVAASFNEALGIDGVMLTKLDGDTRGGAALSVRAVTGQAHQVCRRGRKAGRGWRCSIPSGWPPGFSAWGT